MTITGNTIVVCEIIDISVIIRNTATTVCLHARYRAACSTIIICKVRCIFVSDSDCRRCALCCLITINTACTVFRIDKVTGVMRCIGVVICRITTCCSKALQAAANSTPILCVIAYNKYTSILSCCRSSTRTIRNIEVFTG